MVEEAWRNQNVFGWMSFVLKEKLKTLKAIVKVWSKEEYGGMEDRVERLVEEIKSIDEKGEIGVLTTREVDLWKASFWSCGESLRQRMLW